MSMPELRSAGTSEVLDESGEAAVSRKIEGRSPLRLAYERLRADRAAKIALGTILVIVYFHLVNNLGPNRTHHTTPALSHPEDGAGPGPTHRSEPDQE